MYTDPSFIREHVVKIRLNDNEMALIDAWVRYTGQQKATFIRELILEQARLDMGLDATEAPRLLEGAQMGLFKAV